MIETAVNRFPEEFSEYQAARRSDWDDVATAKMRSWGSYYRKLLIDVYRLHVPDGSDVLEVSCGCGDLLAALKPARGLLNRST